MVLTILFVVAAAVTAMAGEAADTFIKNGNLNAGSVAVKIVDLKTGDVLESHNSNAPLVPASIMKSVTIASLTKKQSLDYVYKTIVYITGSKKEGVLNGNLVVVGSGDPTLNSTAAPQSADIIDEIVRSLKNENIKEIEGGIIIEQDIFKGPAQPATWGSGDLSQAYGAGCFGFNFQGNRSGKSSVANPAQVFMSKLKTALSANNILLDEQNIESGKRKKILEHHSGPLDEIMRSCMMRSDNLFAEALLRTYAIVCGEDGCTDQGARLEMDYWARKNAPMEGVKIVDGSGLSRSNRVTADFMAAVLKQMGNNPYYASFFPLCGEEGTLRHLLCNTRLQGYLAMKTGSMRGIQCYAGYKVDDDYRPTHVVVVIINEMSGSRDVARKAVAEMLLSVFP